MTFNLDKLNYIHLDILREIGNIGAGNAVTSLASIINKKINMDVPKVRILDFKDVSDALGQADMVVSGIYFDLEGELQGNVLLILNSDSTFTLLNMLFNRNNDKNDITQLDDIEKSAVSEIGNILVGSYITAISTFTNFKLKISPPSLAIDMAGAILSVPAIQFGEISDKVLFIETTFSEGDNKVIGDFFLIPDYNSYDKLLKSFGVEC